MKVLFRIEEKKNGKGILGTSGEMAHYKGKLKNGNKRKINTVALQQGHAGK